MRLALITDIHGNLAALEAVAADLRRRRVDQVVNLGDCLSGPLLPLETAQFLMAEGWPSIAGNHERQILDRGSQGMGASDAYARSQLTVKELAWLRSLASSRRITPDVLLCHGTPRSDTEYFLETVTSAGVRPATADEIEARLASHLASDLASETAPLVACGHTHVSRVVRTKQGQLIVNPGSVGLPAYDDVHPFPHAIETGSPDARYAIVEESDNGWVVSLLTVPYDHKSMARLARLRGRPEWEHALLTGYMP